VGAGSAVPEDSVSVEDPDTLVVVPAADAAVVPVAADVPAAADVPSAA